MGSAGLQAQLDALKRRHPLGELVEALGVRLQGRGRVRQGVCPFHDDEDPSFTVYADSQRFHCFGCGVGGDVLEFVGRTQGLSFPGALRWLDDGSHRTRGVAVRSESAVVRTKRVHARPAPRDRALLTAAARFYAGGLRRSPLAREYLASRGIDLRSALRLGLGYASGHGLRSFLESAGFDGEGIRDCGLFVHREAERFAGMVVVPDVSGGGLVRWLVGRAVAPWGAPRFQALPGSKPVLGLGRLGPAPSWAVLTEGVFDWLTLAGWGLPACAALGTQGMEKAAASLRGCGRVFLAFDADDAGRDAVDRLQSLLGWRAVVVSLPDGVGDAAELAAAPRGRAVFLRLMARAAHASR